MMTLQVLVSGKWVTWFRGKSEIILRAHLTRAVKLHLPFHIHRQSMAACR